jgi:hypothetical protein
MVDEKTPHLQSEVNRIAEKLNATSRAIEVGVVLKKDDINMLIDNEVGITTATGSVATKDSTGSATSMTSSTGSPPT